MKRLFITGAAHGTGTAIARRFMSDGWGTVLTSRKEETAKHTAEALSAEFVLPALGIKLDPADGTDAVDAVFERLEPPDALVLNSASMGIGMNPLTVGIAEWSEVIQTNVIWNFAIARAAARKMKDRGGSIVFLSSNTCRRAIQDRSAYIASKGAICAMAKALAVDLSRYRIRVNCILPGVINTDRWQARPETDKQSRLSHIPLGKTAEFGEIAEGVFYLANATQCTGTELVIDGGAESKLW